MVVAVDVYAQAMLLTPSIVHKFVEVTTFTPLIARVKVMTIFMDPKLVPPNFIDELNLIGNWSLCYPKEFANI